MPRKNQALSQDELKNIRIKDLQFAWISGLPTLLRDTLNTPAVCTIELSDPCEKYSALLSLMDPSRASDSKLALRAKDRAQKVIGPTRAIWATLALENARAPGFEGRIALLSALGEGLGKLDPTTRFALLPLLSVSIPSGLRQAALEIRAQSKLKLEKADLDRRTRYIQKMDAAITKLLDLPWQRIRASALNELAGLYSDFSKDLAALPAPQGLSGEDLKAYNQTIGELKAPFDKKSDGLRTQALTLASDSTIEPETYNDIATASHTKYPLSTLKSPIAGLDLFEAIRTPRLGGLTHLFLKGQAPDPLLSG